MNLNYIQHLAKIAIKIGVNLQKNQKLLINSPLEGHSFAKLVAEEGYKAGAKDVRIQYHDDEFSKMRYQYADIETLKEVPKWFIDKNNTFIEEDTAVISIYATDPDLLKGSDPQKIHAASSAIQMATKDYHDAIMNNTLRWCVLSIPTLSWAKKVFPTETPLDAQELLWDKIIKITQADLENPIAAWEKHDLNLKNRATLLNKEQFVALHYKNKLGTDLTVHMPNGHIWAGGSEFAKDNIKFFPNIPTFEVFSAPDRNKVDGTVVASYPLVFNGQLIDHFSLTFSQGKVIEYSAETGYEALKTLIDIDEGSSRLGEIAIVPYHSPISQTGILFYNTLFDENASCHFALGAAYPTCIENSDGLTEKELLEKGLNCSATHVDFMVGTEDLSITGIRQDGTTSPILKNGDWV